MPDCLEVFFFESERRLARLEIAFAAVSVDLRVATPLEISAMVREIVLRYTSSFSTDHYFSISFSSRRRKMRL